jgi:hypothetical protein
MVCECVRGTRFYNFITIRPTCAGLRTARHKMKSVKNHLALGDNGDAASLRSNPNKNVVPNSFWNAQFMSQYRTASWIHKYNREIFSQAPTSSSVFFVHTRGGTLILSERVPLGLIAFFWRPCVYRWSAIKRLRARTETAFGIKSITKPQCGTVRAIDRFISLAPQLHEPPLQEPLVRPPRAARNTNAECV